MAHQSLYRAYRPQSFKDVEGQPHITEALLAQLQSGKVGHAYLFSGSRGLGKTSVARIFAKELKTSDRDLYEIDAASNNSVENIRSLTENIHTLPFESTYKVFILDEAHMLSKGAWNAFLKTLEEPPAHALFILATTELDRVPETVQSRCQVFEFRKPSREGITSLVEKVAKKEGYALERGVGELISLLAAGSYRDALSTLEKVCAVSKDKKISKEEAEQATGAPKHELVFGFVEALNKGDEDTALSVLRKVEKQDVDVSLYLSLVLEQLRAILLIRHAKDLHVDLKKEWGEEFETLQNIAGDGGSKITYTTLKIFLETLGTLRYAPVPTLPLELAVIELKGQDRD